MRYSLLLLAAGAALTFTPAAQAAPIGGVGAAADTLSLAENAQFMFEGRRYCFYPNGWRGAGWYRCGYHLRRGFGWGGPMGWQGWSYERGPRYGRSEREFRGDRRSRGEGGGRLGVEGEVRGGTTGQGGAAPNRGPRRGGGVSIEVDPGRIGGSVR